MSSRSLSVPIEPFDCPYKPHSDYPKEWPVADIISNWDTDNASERAVLIISGVEATFAVLGKY
eukprot:16226-Heterococcus_DN1.PRE.4